MTWKRFRYCWPFGGNSWVNTASPIKVLMVSLRSILESYWVNSRGDLRSHDGYLTPLHMVTIAWWRHQIETFPALLALCAGNSPVTGALMFYLIYAWINGWVNHREAGDLRRHHAHYYVTVMIPGCLRVKDKTGLSVNIILGDMFFVDFY